MCDKEVRELHMEMTLRGESITYDDFSRFIGELDRIAKTMGVAVVFGNQFDERAENRRLRDAVRREAQAARVCLLQCEIAKCNKGIRRLRAKLTRNVSANALPVPVHLTDPANAPFVARIGSDEREAGEGGAE